MKAKYINKWFLP